MTDNSYINDVLVSIRVGHLHEAIEQLQSFIATNPYAGSISHALDDIVDDYRRMEGYWADGYHDPQLPGHFVFLAGRLMTLARTAIVESRRRSDPQWAPLVQADATAWRDDSLESVRQHLENDVAELGMLSLEQEHVAKERRNELFNAHFNFMASLVRHVIISRPWSFAEAEAWSELLLSPTLDPADIAELTSAITLAIMAAYDGQKLAVLCHVYLRSGDRIVQQRALVGLCLASVADNTPDVNVYNTVLSQLDGDEATIKRFEDDVTAVQVQLLHAAATTRDAQTIQREIMPDLTRYSMKSMRQAEDKPHTQEEEDEAMRDIIDPDAAEREVETVERRFSQMMDMQRQGVDIYFGGFSQMKRFPFFSRLDAWITPFTTDHPAVRQVLSGTKHHDLVEQLVGNMSFCDSDKYSFVFALATVIERLPPSLLEMMSHAKAISFGGDKQAAMGLGLISPEQAEQPAYIRAAYLQDLYRFFRLWQGRAMFRDPFDESLPEGYLFLAHRGWAHSPMNRHLDKIAAHLVRAKRHPEALYLLRAYPRDARQTYEYHMLVAQSLMATGLTAVTSAPDDSLDFHIAQALTLRPGDRTATACAARRAFQTNDYQTAATHYTALLEATPDNFTYQLCLATCQANLGRAEEALKTAYRLDYEYPDDKAVRRLLAWALTISAQYDKADDIYTALTLPEDAATQDLLSHGLCKWAAGSPRAASVLIARYLRHTAKIDTQMARREQFNTDVIRANRQFFDIVGITAEETELMAAMAC